MHLNFGDLNIGVTLAAADEFKPNTKELIGDETSEGSSGEEEGDEEDKLSESSEGSIAESPVKVKVPLFVSTVIK